MVARVKRMEPSTTHEVRVEASGHQFGEGGTLQGRGEGLADQGRLSEVLVRAIWDMPRHLDQYLDDDVVG